MKKLLYIISALGIVALMAACKQDTRSYADLVNIEENHISNFVDRQHLDVKSIDEETLTDWTKQVLNDSIDPASLMSLNQWYTVTEGNFKRLYFKINNWGANHDRWMRWQAYKDSVANNQQPRVKPDSVSFYSQKMVSGSYVLVRYDSLYNMTDTLDIHKDMPASNLNPYDYQIVYGWNEYYYATSYYSYQLGSSSAYACTSGGLAFAPRFLWYDSEVSLIVPFSLVPSEFSSYYYTLYYGRVKYSKPNYLPE